MMYFGSSSSIEQKRYLRQAFLEARNSPDPSTKNGAIILNASGHYIGAGCNTFPPGVSSSAERLERPLKYELIEHAERTAIYSAALRGYSLRGTTMYCPWFACAPCARAIISVGIISVVGHQICMDNTPSHWQDSVELAFKMFDEAGIKYQFYEGSLGIDPILFNGELLEV